MRATGANNWPVGILAFVLALAIAFFGLNRAQSYAVEVAGQYVRAVADKPLSIKWLTLTFQRAAYADGHFLPIYGSSELYCCAEPYYATQVFATQPTGFDAFAVGGIGSGDLHNLQMFAALGDVLRGKLLVLSESPPYFLDPKGLPPSYYAGNFSPEIAEAFVFSTVSLDIREGGARRMLDYPATLKDRPLLHLAVSALADPTPLHLAEYDALYPIGRLESWSLQLQDAWTTVRFIQNHPELSHDVPDPAPVLDWSKLLPEATQIMVLRSLADPFGFPLGEYQRVRDEERDKVTGALLAFCSGQTNRDGEIFPYPTALVQGMVESNEWSDLDLELRALEEVGARPLVWSVTLPGTFDNYTPLSAPARQQYYRTFASQMARHPLLPTLDLSAHDEDRYFLTDTSAHFSTRGWIFIDRALDMYWHGQPIDQIQSTLDAMNRQVPPVGPPPRSSNYCTPPMLYGV